jgi:FkbM family methyltransferase
MAFLRRVLNNINSITSLCNFRVCTVAEYKHLEYAKYIDLLKTNAERIGKQGAKEAFIEYILFRDSTSNTRQLTSILACSLYDDLQQLQQIAKDKASQHAGNSIDDFMAFYADNWQHSRSQWSQDMFVWFVNRGKKNLRYLEIGAADGITHSNTLALRDHLSWNGVLVEPHPRQFESLKFSRGRSDTLYNVAAGPPDAEGFINLIDAGQLSRSDSLKIDDMHSDFLARVSERVTVRQQSFESIMQLAGPLDYLSLDVEGAELDLLKWIPWNNISPPKIITLEHNWRQKDISDYRDLMKALNYKEVFCEYDWLRRGDLWFIHNGFFA